MEHEMDLEESLSPTDPIREGHIFSSSSIRDLIFGENEQVSIEQVSDEQSKQDNTFSGGDQEEEGPIELSWILRLVEFYTLRTIQTKEEETALL